jgi:hypothetical protein
MQLSDILEEQSVKMIAGKTKISEENLENLLAKKFENLKKVKTMGFISILEREYKADLTAIRQEANDYYNANNEDQSVTLGATLTEEKKGKSGFFLLFILLLLAYATWYFFTQFDKKHLSELLPFIDKKTIENFVGTSEETDSVAEDLSIAKVNMSQSKKVDTEIESIPQKTEETEVEAVESIDEVSQSEENTSIQEVAESEVVTKAVEDITVAVDEDSDVSVETEDTQAQVDSTESLVQTDVIDEPAQVDDTEEITQVEIVKNTSIQIIPARRLWFGLTDMKRKKRKNLTISKAYTLDVRSQSWLIATSIAPFTIVAKEDKKSYKNGRSHYFKIDADGIHPLTKKAYVKQGGYRRW